MGKTIVEKIFNQRLGREVKIGDIVVAPVDLLVGHDAKTPPALKLFEDLGGELGLEPEKIVQFLDHFSPCYDKARANVNHKVMRDFSRKTGAHLYEQGGGICHVVIPEEGFAKPGDLIACGDGHAAIYGAVNAFSVAISPNEIATVLKTGKLWFKIPETIRLNIQGRPPAGVYAKDIILGIIRLIGPEGANYKMMEVGGEGLRHIDMDGRFTICSMMMEIGAKSAILEPDRQMQDWIEQHVRNKVSYYYPDEQARYADEINLDISSMEPLVVAPHEIGNIHAVSKFEGLEIDQVFIGSCTNAYYEDLRTAAELLKNRKVPGHVRLVVAPGSRKIYQKALDEGVLTILFKAGAHILPPSCGVCISFNGNFLPADGEVVLSTANYNNKGRLGSEEASIYLSSPATAAASAYFGKITDPRKLLGENP
jgi:3-isopropylmalate/(R)-2-methylmalate dehydratase large subunit